MAQLLTLMSLLLLLFAALNPKVCCSRQTFNERRDRAPYIESSDQNHQHLDDKGATIGSRLKKGSTMDQGYSVPGSNEEYSADSLVDKNIRSVFATNFGPGLHLFKNTAPYINQAHSIDEMSNDEAKSQTPPSMPSNHNTEFFKVQRNPDGKLSLVYNEDYVQKVEKDKMDTDNDSQTHFPNGLAWTKDKVATSPWNAYNGRIKDTAIHFPTEEPANVSETNEVNNMNGCLDGEHSDSERVFCNRARNYPDKSYLESLIKKKFQNFESSFGEDLLPQTFSQRMNNAPNEQYLCRSRDRVIYPESGENKDYNWLYIVNSPNFKQGIRIEECLNHGSTCGNATGFIIPKTYTATCEQSYVYRSLVAYTNETIVKDTFRFPSCCKCVLRPT